MAMKRFLSTPFLSSLVSTILIKLIYETRVNFTHYIYVRVIYINIRITLLILISRLCLFGSN